MRETLLAPTKAELEQAAKEWEKNLPPGAVIHEGWDPRRAEQTDAGNGQIAVSFSNFRA